MKLILSPTKTMDFSRAGGHDPETTVPEYQAQALELNRILSAMAPEAIQKLFNTSEALTRKTVNQIQDFQTARTGPALFAFRGEAFKTLDPDTFTAEDLAFAQDHLRICSGLYGLLRPLDGIRPYRLDLSTPLKTDGQSLTASWKSRGVPWLEDQMAPNEPLINLASEEYAALFRGSALENRMITLAFKEAVGGKLKTNSVRAKQARGLFAGAIIRNRILTPESIKTLFPQGYVYSQPHSSAREWVFICQA